MERKTCVSLSFLLLYPLSVIFITRTPADCGGIHGGFDMKRTSLPRLALLALAFALAPSCLMAKGAPKADLELKGFALPDGTVTCTSVHGDLTIEEALARSCSHCPDFCFLHQGKIQRGQGSPHRRQLAVFGLYETPPQADKRGVCRMEREQAAGGN